LWQNLDGLGFGSQFFEGHEDGGGSPRLPKVSGQTVGFAALIRKKLNFTETHHVGSVSLDGLNSR
jgi:hypothetical protein